MDIKLEIFKYAKENFDSDPEFLWPKYPEYAVLRSKKNSKWYALVAAVPAEKLGIGQFENVDILNVKCDPIMISSLVDNRRYFRAYHMNKEHWITVTLNGEVPKEEIFSMIALSFEIVNAKNRRK